MPARRSFGGDARVHVRRSSRSAQPSVPTARFECDLHATSIWRRSPISSSSAALRFAGSRAGTQRARMADGTLRRAAAARARSSVTPPPGVEPMTASLAAGRAGRCRAPRARVGPFAPMPLPAHVPIARRADLSLRSAPASSSSAGGSPPSRRTSPSRDDRRGATVARSVSRDERRLAGKRSGAGRHHHRLRIADRAVAFGGRGEFDGAMTGPFRRPRVEGTSAARICAPGTRSGATAAAHIVVENSYVDVTDGVIRHGRTRRSAPTGCSRSAIRATTAARRSTRASASCGAISIAAARVRARRLSGVRPAVGRVPPDRRVPAPLGFGGMTIDDGVAYGEPFQQATAVAALRRRGRPARRRDTGEGRRHDHRRGVRRMGLHLFVQRRRAPHSGRSRSPRSRIRARRSSGLAEFTAGGSGTFDAPRYDVRFRVNDLFIARRRRSARSPASLALRGKELSGEVDAASPRLALTGTGRIALDAAGRRRS